MYVRHHTNIPARRAWSGSCTALNVITQAQTAPANRRMCHSCATALALPSSILSASIDKACTGNVAATSDAARTQARRRTRLAASAAASSTASVNKWVAPPVVVVGAGIAGLAAALALHKAGIAVTVLEQRGDQQLRGDEGAAIGVWENAWVALDALGVADQLRPHFLRLNRVELCSADGQLLRGFGFAETDAGSRPPRSPASTQPGPSKPADIQQDITVSGAGSEFRGLTRSHLLRTLADALPPGVLRSAAEVTRVIQGSLDGDDGAASSTWPEVVLADGSKIQGSVIIGADGVRSVVSQALGLPPANYAGYTAHRGIARLPHGIQSIDLPANTIRQVWGAGVRAGLYPLDNHSVYWFTCWNGPQNSPVPDDPAAMQREALNQVKGWSWGLERAIQCTDAASISRSRIMDRWTRAPVGKGLVTLCGDAAHPMTPNLGQGGCVALEDAVVLANTLVGGAHDTAGRITYSSLAASLRHYEQERVARCLPLTVRSYVMGALLQLPYAPVCLTRNTFVKYIFPPSHFLDHTTFNCGTISRLQ